jgi:tRNA pseudouridine55 synthase
LLVDKPVGPTSHDVVARVRRALGTRAVGHTGTLDPFASGLLVVLVGKATRLARFVQQRPKTYAATARLGARTATDDLTGAAIAAVPGLHEPPDRQAVEAAMRSFVGPQKQRPPAFSAKHVAGERSHVMARRGEAPELAESDIVVHAVELTGYDFPTLTFRTTVSAGTYIRALARDLGERLGMGAYLTALRREAIGELRVEQAITLEQVTPEALLPPLAVLGHLPRIEVSEDEAVDLGHGRTIRRGEGQSGAERATPRSGNVLAVAPGERLIAVARWQADGLGPEVVLEALG